MKDYLVLGNSREVFRITTDDILYVSAVGSCSHIYFTYGGSIEVKTQLGEILELMWKLPHTGNCFIRLDRSLVINMLYLYYINFSDEKLVLLDRNKDKTVVEAPIKALRELASRIKNEVKPDN